MAVRTKGRRKFEVDGRPYVWFVGDDDDSADKILHVISHDKRLIVHYHLGQEDPERRFAIALGQEFGGVVMNGIWRRFLCPRWESDEGKVTPRDVRRLILWSLSEQEPRVEVDWRGERV